MGNKDPSRIFSASHLASTVKRLATTSAARGWTLLVFLVLLFLWMRFNQWYEIHLIATERTTVEQQMQAYGAGLTGVIRGRLAILEALRAFAISASSQEDLRHEFASFASGLAADKNDLRTIELLPYGTGQPLVYPDRGDGVALREPLEQLMNLPTGKIGEEVRQAVATRQLTLGAPKEKQPGEWTLTAYLAIYHENQLWGMGLIILDIPRLVREAGLNQTSGSLSIGLRDPQSGAVFWGENRVFAEDPVLFLIPQTDNPWELAARPSAGWRNSISSALTFSQWFGLILVIAITGLTDNMLTRQEKLTKAVERRTAALQKSEAHFRALFDASPISIWEEDFSAAQQRFTELRLAGITDLRAYLNENPAEVADLASKTTIIAFNYTSVRIMGADSKNDLLEKLSAYFTETSLGVFREEIVALFAGQTRFNASIPVPKANGEPGIFEIHLQVVPGCEATLERVLVSFIDMTDRTRAENELRETKNQLAAILKAIGDGVAVVDLDGKLVYVNDSMAQSVGYASPEELLNQSDADKTLAWLTAIDEAGQPVSFDQLPYRQILRGQPAAPMLVSLQPIDEANRQWSIVKAHPIFDEAGQPEFIVTVTTDITEQKMVEERLKALLREKNILLAEIHHRVKNNMQTIISLLELQADGIQDERIGEVLRESRNRIHSMAMVHEQLYRANEYDRIDFEDYINLLAISLLQIYAIVPGQIKLEVAAENLTLDIKQAVPCGLLLNEIITNAFKHAFPAGQEGIVRVEMSNDGSYINLHVWDNGVGFPGGANFISSATLGLQLIHLLVTHDLGGSIELRQENGTEYLIRFPCLA